MTIRRYLSTVIAFSLLLAFAVVGLGSPPTEQERSVAVVKTVVVTPAVSETAEVVAVITDVDTTNKLNTYNYNMTGVITGDFARVESRAPGIRSQSAAVTDLIARMVSGLEGSPPAPSVIVRT